MDFKTINMVDLPTPPQSLLAVIRYCSEDKAETDKLADLIQIDPLLSTELLKIANSSYFGFGGNITSLNRVTVLLGMKTVRSLALGIALKGISARKQILGFEDHLFWEDSIRRAAICSTLGSYLELDKDECFTAGLLQDIGLLVLFSQEEKELEFIRRYREYSPDVRKLLEQEELGECHDSVAAFLATEWSLPSSLVGAICHHHDQPASTPELADLLYCADWFNCMFTREPDSQTLAFCLKLLTDRLQIPEEDAQKLLAELPDSIKEIAHAFGHDIDFTDKDFDTLINDATSQISEYNIELQEVTLRLTHTIEERNRLSSELNNDIAIAQEVQQALLPMDDKDLPIYAFNVPAKALSGDFYDYMQLPDGRLCFCLGDVSGKGVYSSLLMVKACSLYRSLCGKTTDQAQLAMQLNKEISRIAVRGMFITMVIGIFDPETDLMHLVNAGHLPALFIGKDGSVEEIPSSSPPLGILEDANYSAETLYLRGRSLYLFSDGITETVISENRMLEVGGLAATLKKINHEPAEKRIKIMHNYFRKRQETLRDDTTLLLLQE